MPQTDLNGRKVVYMKLHSEFFVIDMGPVPTTISTGGSGNRYPDLSMVKTPDGVFCTATGAKDKGSKKCEFLIPNGNITGMEFAPE